MKGTTPEMGGTGEEVRSNRTFEAYPKARPILMCWRAFRPNDIEDPDVESISSAGNNNIQVQIEMPRLFVVEVIGKTFTQVLCACQCVRHECSGFSSISGAETRCCASLQGRRCLKQKLRKKELEHWASQEDTHVVDSASARALGVAKDGGYCRA